MSTFPPLIFSEVRPTQPVETVNGRLTEARSGGARWLIVIEIRFNPPPPDGVPGLASAEYAVYNLSDGTSRRIQVEHVPPDAAGLGAAIGREISRYL